MKPACEATCRDYALVLEKMSYCRVFQSRERLGTPYVYRHITHRLIATWYEVLRQEERGEFFHNPNETIHGICTD
jgi:hypothetical protein